MQNGSGESCESASTSSVGSNQSHSKAPGAQLHQHHQSKHASMFQNSLNNNNNSGGLLSAAVSQMSHFPELNSDFAKQVSRIELYNYIPNQISISTGFSLFEITIY